MTDTQRLWQLRDDLARFVWTQRSLAEPEKRAAGHLLRYLTDQLVTDADYEKARSLR